MQENLLQNMRQTIIDHHNLFLPALRDIIIIALLGFALAFILGTLIALVTTNPNKNIFSEIAKKIFAGYVLLIRGLPLTVQLLLWFFVIFPLVIGLRLPAFTVAIIVFSIDGSAYISETIRGAVQSVDKGQLEAGRAAGLTNFQTMRKIILPQAYRNSVPQFGNELIGMTKATSVLSFITITDITLAANLIIARTFEPITPYLLLGITYLVIVYFLTLIIKFFEKVVFVRGRKYNSRERAV